MPRSRLPHDHPTRAKAHTDIVKLRKFASWCETPNGKDALAQRISNATPEEIAALCDSASVELKKALLAKINAISSR